MHHTLAFCPPAAGPKSTRLQLLPRSTDSVSWQAVPYHTGGFQISFLKLATTFFGAYVCGTGAKGTGQACLASRTAACRCLPGGHLLIVACMLRAAVQACCAYPR